MLDVSFVSGTNGFLPLTLYPSRMFSKIPLSMRNRGHLDVLFKRLLVVAYLLPKVLLIGDSVGW